MLAIAKILLENSYGIIKEVDILSSNIELSACEDSLVNVISRELILKQLISKVRIYMIV